MKGMGKDKGVGLLIGIGKPKGEHEMPDGSMMDDSEMMEDDEGMREAKVTAARALLSSIKGNDPEGIVDAYEALKDCY